MVFGVSVPISLAFVWPLRFAYMNWWQATLLFAVLAVPIVLLGMRSLAGLGPIRRWVAMGIRLLVLLLMILILADARWQRENKIVEVIALRDISQSVGNVQAYPDKTLQASIEAYLRKATDPTVKPADDRIGVVSFHSQALIDAVPNTTLALDARAIRDVGHGTDIAQSIQLALATLGKDSMHRLLLLSDGNNTTGDLEAAVSAAVAQHVPIDVMPLDYNVKNEVLVDRFVAPVWKRENEPFSLEVILRSTNAAATTGKLTVLHNDQPMDLDPFTAGIQSTRLVTLQPGRNVERIAVPALEGGNPIHRFHATFEGAGVTVENNGRSTAAGDTLTQNNAADAFTFVRGKGKVLYIDNVADGGGQYLRKALTDQGITLDADRTTVDQFPRSLLELQNYDAIILANVPRGSGGLDEESQKMLASYVHDMGGGLLMIGGDQALGAGGWQGSKLEEILPVNMDIPAQRQVPKGALVLVMHSCEMPDGNYWGEQCALKAVETLSAQDEIGVISFDWSHMGAGGVGGSQWDFPLEKKGDGSKVAAAIKNMKLGDMPSFDDSMDVALHGINGNGGLDKADAKQKHVIIISDGDPQKPNAKLTADYLKNKVSVSTVSVYPHDQSDKGLPPTMRSIANDLLGRAYGPINGNFSQLPQIFIKEATVVRRSLIHEEAEGIPVKLEGGTTSEMIKGLTSLPSVKGMVLTSRKQDPQIELPLSAGKAADPLLAHWQTGLGKAAVWTSDAYNKWSAAWIASGEYEKFWAQVIRGVARPPMNSDLDVRTEQVGDKGHIVVEALDRDNGFTNFLNVGGTVVGPDLKPMNVQLVQTAPGKYEGTFDANDAGTYVSVLNYRGANNQSGVMLGGLSVNSSPELRDLKSNDALLHDIANKTGGRILPAFDAASADLFTRNGLVKTASPLQIWDILLPLLIVLMLIDVSVRRIAWDFGAMRRSAAKSVRNYTTTRKVETKQSLDALRKVRSGEKSESPQTSTTPSASAPPDASRKFEAGKGVAGDINQVVGGATNQPVKTPKPKDPPAQSGDAMSGLMAAKRRAQRKIDEQNKEPPKS